MSINDINNAAAAMNQLKARYEGFFSDTDNDIGQRRDAYDSLASDLSGIVDGKLTKTFLLDFINGDDSSELGNVAFPLKTIKEAFSRMVPGGHYILKLFGDQTHVLTGSVSAKNSTVVFERYGGTNEPVLSTTGNADHPSIDYCNFIQLLNSTAYVSNIHLETGVSQRGAPHFSSGLFECSYNGSLRTLHSDFSLGDFPLLVTNAGQFCSFVFQHGAMSRKDGSIQTKKAMVVQTGSFVASSVSLPAGEVWSDYITVVRGADGKPINIVSNLVL